MKYTHICPKCKSIDIIHIGGVSKDYDTENNVVIGETESSNVEIHRYLCCKCGFSEEWIDMEDIEKIKKSKNPLG